MCRVLNVYAATWAFADESVSGSKSDNIQMLVLGCTSFKGKWHAMPSIFKLSAASVRTTVPDPHNCTVILACELLIVMVISTGVPCCSKAFVTSRTPYIQTFLVAPRISRPLPS